MKRKLKTLKRIVDEYCSYTKWEWVEVYADKGYIAVVWVSPRIITSDNQKDLGCHLLYTTRVFPESELNRRIKSYRSKVGYEEQKEENEG